MGRPRPGARQDTADRPFGFARNGADAKALTRTAKSNPDLARGRRARVPPERFVPSLNWGRIHRLTLDRRRPICTHAVQLEIVMRALQTALCILAAGAVTTAGSAKADPRLPIPRDLA